MGRTTSTALPVAYVVLRILIVLNWVYGACILALLVFSFVNEPFLLRALKLGSVGENPGLVYGIRAIAALGILAVPLNLAVLNRLVAMVGTVRIGDPFVASNAYRLNAIAWLLLGQQLLSVAIGLIARDTPSEAPVPVTEQAVARSAGAGGPLPFAFATSADAPACHECGSIMVRNGACYKCLNCGATSGCS